MAGNMEIRINNLKWKFSQLDEIKESFCVFEETECFGLTRYEDLSVEIKRTLPKDLKRRTLIHELTHVFLFSYGQEGEEYQEEDICKFTESHLDEILRLTEMILDNFNHTGGTDELQG